MNPVTNEALLAALRQTYAVAEAARAVAQKNYALLTDLHSELVKAGVITINPLEP